MKPCPKAKDLDQSPYRKIVRKTWRKKRFRSLSPELKMILLYLWTGPDSTNPGIYYLSPATVAEDLGYGIETVSEALRTLTQAGWVMYNAEEKIIFFPKWFEYDKPPNKNVVTSYWRHLLDLPVTKLSNYYLETLRPFLESHEMSLDNDKGIVPEPFVNGFDTVSIPSRIQEHEQEQEHKLGADKNSEVFPQSGDLATTSPNGNKPLTDEERKTAQEKLDRLLGGRPKPYTSGDCVKEIKDYIKKLIPDAEQKDIGAAAGKVFEGIRICALGKKNFSDPGPEPQWYVFVLRQGLGDPDEWPVEKNRPKDIREFYQFFGQILKPDNGDYLHEWCSNAHKLVRRER